MENPDIKVKTGTWFLDEKLVIENQTFLASPHPHSFYDRLRPQYSNRWHSKRVAVGWISMLTINTPDSQSN